MLFRSIPWNKVEYIDVSFSFTEVMKVCHETGHTRIPAVEKNSVVGFLHTKQFLSGYYLNGTSFWQQFISSMIEVHVASNPFEVLKLLQKNKNHMALVKNDIGESVGIITLEDILETVFGEIGDEDDDIVRIRKLNSMRGHF